jgi:hypothetical protein
MEKKKYKKIKNEEPIVVHEIFDIALDISSKFKDAYFK